MPPARQLELIPWVNPLAGRIGAEFFRELPASPGVYRMLSREAEVLYVGSSRNLRQRVGSYRAIGPARHPRRLCRLVHTVAAIIIEPTDDEASARALEAGWIRTYRPRFNRALNRPAETIWIGLERREGRLLSRWSRTAARPESWPVQATSWGPFPHRRPLHWLQALRRTLWWMTAAPPDLRHCPPALRTWGPPAPTWEQEASDQLPVAEGASPALLGTALAAAAESRVHTLAARPWNAPLCAFWEHDREILAAAW